MCAVKDCERPPKAKGLCAMHYQRWRRTGDPEKLRRAGRPRDDMLDHLRERFTGTWSPTTITRYKRVMRLCSLCCSGEFDISELEMHLSEVERYTNFGNLKRNVAGAERMARAKAAAMQAGCTEDEWAELRDEALYRDRRFQILDQRRVEVAELEHLVWGKLESMVREGRVERVSVGGRTLIRKR